ncbi:MAG: GNAT family N-acetyltransferase [Candidatus Ornithospirochaeta sp.]
MRVRRALESDASRIREIYAPYVEETAITFEYEVPSIAEMRGRIREREGKYPFLVLEDDDGVVEGYAYLSPFKERSAYDWCAETSIYISRYMRGKGLGSLLLSRLEEEAKKMNLLSLYACIAIPGESQDPYLTDQSEIFHSRHGYTRTGYFPSSGYKFSRWYHMIWMEKEIGKRIVPPKSVIWYGKVEDAV